MLRVVLDRMAGEEGAASNEQAVGVAAVPTAPVVEPVAEAPESELTFIGFADRTKVPHPLALAALTALDSRWTRS